MGAQLDDVTAKLIDLIGHAIPDDTAEQVDAFAMIARNAALMPRTRPRLLDLGCGTGDSFDRLVPLFDGLRYTGADIEVSPEVARRTRDDIDFVSYDGVRLPLEAASFEICFCKQVLEHVRHPDAVIGEVARVLVPGGIFVGSVSFLEPYHSRSIFNWSPYGLVTVLGDHGLETLQLRPGIDGVSMILRRLFGKKSFQRSFGQTSMFNHFIETEAARRSVQGRNAAKLEVAGHVAFLARKG